MLKFTRISITNLVSWVRQECHECNMSDTSATRVRQERYERNVSAKQMLHERKNLILITTRFKPYFHTPIFSEVKDNKERNKKTVVNFPKISDM